MTCIILSSYYYSSSPLNKGYPVYNSAITQPKDQISTAWDNFPAKITSGAL